MLAACVPLPAPGGPSKIILIFIIYKIILRNLDNFSLQEGKELGKKAQEYINNGQLVPDELTCGLVASRLSEEDCKDGFMLMVSLEIFFRQNT